MSTIKHPGPHTAPTPTATPIGFFTSLIALVLILLSGFAGASTVFETQRDPVILAKAVALEGDDRGEPLGFASLDVSADGSSFLIHDTLAQQVVQFDQSGMAIANISTSDYVAASDARFVNDRIMLKFGLSENWQSFDRVGNRFVQSKSKDAGFHGSAGPPAVFAGGLVQVLNSTWLAPQGFSFQHAMLLKSTKNGLFFDALISEAEKVGGRTLRVVLRYRDGELMALLVPAGNRVVESPIAIDDAGNVYVLIDDEYKARIERISSFASTISIPKESATAKATVQSKVALPTMTAEQVIRNAEQYLLPKVFIPSTAIVRLTDRPNSTVACRVRPSYLSSGVSGSYEIPYSWGGVSTTSTWASEMASGKLAGHVNSAYSSCLRQPAGIDCSGAVGVAWGLFNHPFSTSSVVGSYAYTIPLSSVGTGDALNWQGRHIVLIANRAFDSAEIIEAVGENIQRVTRRYVSISAYLNQGYVPIRRNNLEVPMVATARFVVRSPYGTIADGTNVTWNFGANTPMVTLDATQSTPAAAPVRWILNGSEISTSRFTSSTLRAGSNVIQLLVNNSVSATAVVNVQGGVSTIGPAANFVIRTSVGNALANATTALVIPAGGTGVNATFDGQGSTPSNLSFTWTINGSGVTSGAVHNSWLRLGSNTVSLQVRDSLGRIATSNAVVNVQSTQASTMPLARFSGTTSPNRGSVNENMSTSHYVPAGQAIVYSLNANASTIPQGANIAWLVNGQVAGSGMTFVASLGRGLYNIDLRITSGSNVSTGRLTLQLFN